MIIYCLGLFIILTAGYLLVRWLTAGRLPFILHLFLGLSLGLGLAGTLAFYVHILLNVFIGFIPIALTLILIVGLWFSPKPNKTKTKPPIKLLPDHGWGLLTLGLLAIPLAIGVHTYPLGGWDAWSCWNLKAKFIFLGHEQWKAVLAPDFWRSNTQYPLQWPLINVWFWDLGGRFDQIVPMLNTLVIALGLAGTLLFGLLELTQSLFLAVTATVLVVALPFGIMQLISQYSDSLLGLYLLSAFISLLLADRYQMPKLKILSMIFLGLLSFIKSEGLVISIVAALLILAQEWKNKKERQGLITAFVLAALPAIIFNLFIAPKNEAFINGIFSSTKPMTWQRLEILGLYPWLDAITLKWNGFWIMAVMGIITAGKRIWQGRLGLIGWTLILYLGVVFSYYAINTFFEIQWWLSTTLARILYAILPVMALWIGLGLKLMDV